jgi:hypothetical protein
MTYEPGAWLRGTLYPQRCDISPDGRWLCYFTLKASARWAPGATYIAISRLPWLTALAAWGTSGTWTRGLHFVDDTDTFPTESPDEGDVAVLRRSYGLAHTHAASFAVERRAGWTETADTPPRAPNDMWDEHRDVTMEKADPAGSGRRLLVRGWYAAFRAMQPERFGPSTYVREDGGDQRELDAQWADWTADGRLLVATRDGRLQWLDSGNQTVRWQVDLAAMAPDPSAPPAEAARW